MKGKLSNNNNKVKVREKYLLHLEATLNLIPYAGGFLATYFSEIKAKRVPKFVPGKALKEAV